MTKHVSALLLAGLLFLVCLGPGTSSARDLDTSTELHTWDATVKIMSGTSYGSGILLNDTFVLTAGHVVDGQEWVQVLFQGVDEMMEAEVYLTGDDPEMDYAVLKLAQPALVPDTHATWYSGRTSDLATGSELQVWGHPLGSALHGTLGLLCERNGVTWRMSAPVAPGNSGGGVFLEDGRLIGVAVRVTMMFGPTGLQMVYHISMFLSLEDIMAATEEAGYGWIWQTEYHMDAEKHIGCPHLPLREWHGGYATEPLLWVE